jgi:hypothetical protein
MLFSPEDGSPAYVGEGYSRARPWVHLKAARGPRSKVVPIVQQIRRWLALGYDIPTVVLRDQLHAGQSKDLEGRLIRVIGRRINGTGCLWNVQPGQASGEPGASARELQHRHRPIPAEVLINRELRRCNFLPRKTRPTPMAVFPCRRSPAVSPPAHRRGGQGGGFYG